MSTSDSNTCRYSFSAGLGLIVLAWSLANCPLSLEAQGTRPPGILFLHLRISSNSVSLVKSNIRPGVWKRGTESDYQAGLECELVSPAGQKLWGGVVNDPRVRHLEYEDPPRSGNLKRKTVRVDVAEFTLRVPFVPGAKRAEFFLIEPGAASTNQLKRLKRVPMGHIELPAVAAPAK